MDRELCVLMTDCNSWSVVDVASDTDFEVASFETVKQNKFSHKTESTFVAVGLSW